LAFASGKLAFYFGPSWRYFNIKEMNPNLDFSIAPVPQLPELGSSDWEAAERGEVGLTNINWASFWVEGVSKSSPNQKAAWKFLEYLSSKEVITNLYSAQSQTRDFGEIYPLVELAEGLKTNPTLASFVSQASSSKSWYLCSFTHDNGLNDGMIKYYEDAVNSILDGADPSLVTETLSAGVTQVLNRYKISF
jgi:ABC-type glycerol-3-phosphate transport system substrate-binding protein